MNVLVLLLGGVDLLLALTLAALEAALHPEFGVLSEALEGGLSDVAALAHKPLVGQTVLGEELVESAVGRDGHLAGGAIELVQPQAHVVNYIQYIFIKITFLIFPLLPIL